MKRSVAGTALLVVGLAIGARAASAQVWAVPKGVGVTVAGDFMASFDPTFKTVQGRVALGLPMFGVQATFQPNVLDAAENNAGVDAAVQLMPMPVSIRIQAGAHYGLDSKVLFVPAGAVIGFNVPSPALSVDPWVFPQVRFTHVSVAGISANNTDFGVTGGVNIGLPSGLGGHVALDYDNASSSFSAGVGVHFKISVPSLGMM